MHSSRNPGQLRWLAAAGVAAALVALPWLASVSDTTSSPRDVDVALTAGLDFALSIGGIPLIEQGTAFAVSSPGNMAIAFGPDSTAVITTGYEQTLFGNLAIATDGGTASVSTFRTGIPQFGDLAFANGAGSNAVAAGVLSPAMANDGGAADTNPFGFGFFDSASASGAGSTATVNDASYQSPSVFDSAGVVGTNSTATATGIFDSASVGCDSSTASAIGNADIATILTGNDSSASAGLSAAGTPGSFDFAGVFGNNLTADATGGNFLFATAPSLVGSIAAAPVDDFGLGALLNSLGLGSLVHEFDSFLSLF